MAAVSTPQKKWCRKMVFHVMLHLVGKNIQMTDSKSHIYSPFKGKLSHSHTDPHEWCYCFQINLLYKIRIWSQCGSELDPFSPRELYVNLFIQHRVGIWATAHIVLLALVSSIIHPNAGWKEAYLLTSSLCIFISSSVPWMWHTLVSSEISCLQCFSKFKNMDTLWEDS